MQNVLSFRGKNAEKEAILCEFIVRPKDAGDQLVPRPLLQMLMVFCCGPPGGRLPASQAALAREVAGLGFSDS